MLRPKVSQALSLVDGYSEIFLVEHREWETLVIFQGLLWHLPRHGRRATCPRVELPVVLLHSLQFD